MNDFINTILTNQEISAGIITAIIFVIDYVVKKTQNKVDDAIWNTIKKPVVNFIKSKITTPKK